MKREEAFALYAELEDAGWFPHLRSIRAHHWVQIYITDVSGEGVQIERLNKLAEIARGHGMTTNVSAMPGISLNFEKPS